MSKDYKLTEHDTYWVLPLKDKPVSRFLVDSQLTIEFSEPEEERTIVVIGGEFHLQIDRKDFSLSAEKPTTLCPVFGLYRATVESALAFKNGTLEIKFRDGARMFAMPHPDFESWHVTGVRSLSIVCMPGGKLAIWQAEPPEPSRGSTH